MKAFTKSAITKSLLIISVIMLFSTPPSTLASTQPKRQVAQKVAQEWIKVGTEQYKRGFYNHAERSLLQAMGYQKFLTPAQLDKLTELLEKTHSTGIEQSRILKQKHIAEGLIQKGKLIEAKAHLEEVKASKFLTKKQRAQTIESLKQLNSRIDEQKEYVTQIYKNSVESYNAGRLEEARQGFLKVAGNAFLTAPQGRKPEDYLLKIDRILTWQAEQKISQLEAEQQSPKESPKESTEEGIVIKPLTDESSAEVAADEVEPVKKDDSATPVVNDTEPLPDAGIRRKQLPLETSSRRKNILQSYIRAVINNASAKAKNYINRGEFDSAEEAVEIATRILNAKRSRLEDAFFNKYSSQLKQLADSIAREKARLFGVWDDRSAWRL